MAGVDAAGGGTLIVNFAPSIAVGGRTYFSLEGDQAAGGVSVSGVPEPGTFAALGAGLLGVAGLLRYPRSKA